MGMDGNGKADCQRSDCDAVLFSHVVPFVNTVYRLKRSSGSEVCQRKY